MVRWPKEWLQQPQFFLKFFYKKLWEVLNTIDQIEKIWNFGGWIVKIETLVFELKNVVYFGGLNYNFLSIYNIHII
jgi:hypothetical protein